MEQSPNRVPEHEDRIEQIRSLLRAKRDQLTEISSLRMWKHTDGLVPTEACCEESKDWADARIRFPWPPQAGDKTFFRRVGIPEQFLGIDLRGASAQLEICLLIGSRIYVNNELVYEVDYWADTKVVPLALTQNIAGGEEYDIVVHCRKGDGLGYFHDADLRIEPIEQWRFTLDTFAEELAFSAFLARNGDADSKEHLEALREATDGFDASLLLENRWNELQAAIDTARERLKIFEPAAKSYKLHLVGHAHIDMNWLWPWSETESLIRRDFESVDGIMAEFPDVRFSHSQAATYRAMQSKYPELWSRIKARIDESRWDVTASTWVEGDLNMAGYETMARQFLEGIRYSREELGVTPSIGWEPDTFGHPATMPKLLTAAGIGYYYFCRGGPKGIPLFWWEGDDGARVLAYQDPRHYNGFVHASETVPAVVEMAEQYGLRSAMFVFGVGDHGGGVTKQDVRRAIRLNQSRLLPQFVFARSTDFFQDVERSGVRLPVVRGELNPVFEGCYTSHGDIKEANRKTEHALARADSLSVMADIRRLAGSERVGRSLSGAAEKALQEPWRLQCFHQFHDILCGCSIQVTYQEAVPQAMEARRKAEQASAAAMEAMVPSLPPGGQHAGAAVTVFNTLSWTRTDIIRLDGSAMPAVRNWKTGDRLTDPRGRSVPVQKMADGSILFLAKEIPPYGYATYTYERRDEEHDARPSGVVDAKAESPVVLENERYRVSIHHGSGVVSSLYDKRLKRELARTNGMNVFEIHEEVPHGMSAWVVGAVSNIHRLIRGADVRAGENGPVVRSAHVVHRFRSSAIRQEIRMYNGIDRIDFLTVVDWAEQGTATVDAPMLKVSFAAALQRAEAFFDVPFGTVRRETDGAETPALHWFGLSEPKRPGACGIAILNDGKYGCSVHGATLAQTLLRSSYEPDNRPDQGIHKFTYSIYPHELDWKEAQADLRAWELNQPVTAVCGAADRPGAAERGGFFEAFRIETEEPGAGWVEAKGVIAASLKGSRGKGGASGSAWVVRLLETHGRPVRARISCSVPLERAEAVTLAEDPIRPLSLTNRRRTVELGTLEPRSLLNLRLHPVAEGGGDGRVSGEDLPEQGEPLGDGGEPRLL